MLLLAAGQLAGCSGTPFGEQLSRSFSSPDPAATDPAPAGQTPTGASAAAGTAPSPAGTTPQAPAPAAQRPPRAPVLSPAPYRITIKLVGADPAAPAEAVTEALRAAGVPFEVEMIERVHGPAGTTPATPAPAPPAPQAPASPPAATPAPEPR
ncbi:translation initiation factor IF-2 [Cyanobium sp. PCC 7001]|nr:translation initiation factor IF-2 [Cyanobium sp. PCC 7001]